ncbi:DUF3761 domain-containing protein [Salegentibacter sp. JZCK2]|uniref:DUF3761 domain-containing protein n=1 Tax=Salegentibacter tibetensis TaxID=2873600 RepID=UPI001CCFDDC9|nr:DUF3761 domain-containing protein [Salegentibacter tibetensis]MBZ9728331.1 DUF3761 domain-containing protein [Salegentibacter tibetensis]
MKRIFSFLLILVASVSIYEFFISKKSEFVAGENRYYTLYERYFDDDVVLNTTEAYDNDKYHIEKKFQEIQSLFKEAKEIRENLILYRDEIRATNNIQDLEELRSDLNTKQKHLERIKDNLSFQKNSLNELEEYIVKFENEVESMYLYKVEIQTQKQNLEDLNSNLQNFDSVSNYLHVVAEYREIQIDRANELRRLNEEKESKVSSILNYKPKEKYYPDYNNNNYNQPRSNVKFYTNSFGEKVQSPSYYNSPPNGATALCKDGTYSFSRNRRGTCSGHGGVKKWLN